MPIKISIDTLRLIGFNRMAADELPAAIQTELQNLITEQGLPAHLKHSNLNLSLANTQLTLPPCTSLQGMAQHIARSVYAGSEGIGRIAAMPAKSRAALHSPIANSANNFKSSNASLR